MQHYIPEDRTLCNHQVESCFTFSCLSLANSWRTHPYTGMKHVGEQTETSSFLAKRILR
jgi:hypothetical protein